MPKVKEGDRIAIHYRAIAGDRRLLGQTRGNSVLEITAGSDEVLYGLSFGVIGMEEGEKGILAIDAVDAFGEAGEVVERTIPKSRFPADVQVGDVLRITSESTTILLWVIEEGAGDTWRLSSRHPFAGQDIELHVKIAKL